MNIHWLPLAEEDLEIIYQFYTKDKSSKAANKIFNEILDAVDSLANFPKMAPIEPDLSDDEEEYRSLVVLKLFKVIYYIEFTSIFITAVWDCRQSPKANISKIK